MEGDDLEEAVEWCIENGPVEPPPPPRPKSAATDEAPLIGKRIVISGTSRKDMNGKDGVAVAFNPESGRYAIRLGDSLEPSLSLRPVNLVAYEEAFPHNAGAVPSQLPYGGDMMLAMRAQDRDAIRVLMKHRNAVEAGGGGKAGATGVGVPAAHAMASRKATEK